jgi:hypothetical protein
MLSVDELREELVELRRRIKPQAEWTGSDWLGQRAIENRIRMLQNHLRETSQQEKVK